MTVILPYLILLSIAAALSISLGISALRLKPPSGRPFAMLQFGIAVWSLAYAFELSSRTLHGKILAIDVVYVGVSMTVLGWFFFTMEHSGNTRWLTLRNLVLVSALPVVMLPVLWTNPVHGLFATIKLNTSGAYPATNFSGNSLFWVYVAYSYSLLSIGLVIQLRSMIRTPQLFRGQFIALLVGAVIPFIGSILHVSGLSPTLRAAVSTDITPFSFSLSGLAFSWAVLRGRLFDLVPIARGMVIENMSDAVVILDVDNHIVGINPAAEALIDRQAADVVGTPIAEILAGRADLIERYRDLLEVRDEIELDTARGERRIYELRISPIQNRWGGLTGRLIVLRDVTESRLMQQQLKEQLRETLVMNRVLEAATSSLDLTTGLETICRELSEALSLPQAAVAILDKDDEALHVVAEYRDEGRPSALDQVIPVKGNPLTEEVLEAQKPVVVHDVHADPRTVATRELFKERGTVSIIIVPLMMRDQVLGTLGLDSITRRDFTDQEVRLAEKVAATTSQALENVRLYEALQEELAERRRAQAELVIARDAAETASKAKSTFLANMSHELRTPLNSILGYSELLIEGMYGPVTEKQAARLEAVMRNGNHLLNLINDVLDLSKIEAGRVELRIEPISVKVALDNCLSAIEPQAITRGLSIIRALPDDLPDVLGDTGRVNQVFTNLLSNAVKFTPEGSVTVSAKVIQPGDEEEYPYQYITKPSVLVAVQDTGVGIAEENHGIIFEEFRQVDTSSTREFEGTGLGLAITRRLVTLMGGYIWLESALGQGSTFYVTLPVADGT